MIMIINIKKGKRFQRESGVKKASVAMAMDAGCRVPSPEPGAVLRDLLESLPPSTDETSHPVPGHQGKEEGGVPDQIIGNPSGLQLGESERLGDGPQPGNAEYRQRIGEQMAQVSQKYGGLEIRMDGPGEVGHDREGEQRMGEPSMP